MSKVTKQLLAKIFPNTPAAKRDRFVEPFNKILPKYGITTKKRFAAFIANVAIESDRLKTTKEYGSPAYFLKYNGRTNLGNVLDGDGPRYLGRSVLQTTGRYNYWVVVVAYLRVLTGKDWSKSTAAQGNFKKYLASAEYDKLLKEADKYNVNFLAHPELLEQFPHAVEAAGVFVQDKGLNDYADKGQFFSYAGILNTGSAKRKANHYTERLEIYEKALAVIPDNFNLTAPAEASEEIVEVKVESKIEANEDATTTVVTETAVVEVNGGEALVTKTETTTDTPTVDIQESKPYNGIGFIGTIKKDLAAVGVGNLGFQSISELVQQLTGVPEWLTGIIVKVGIGILLLSLIYLLYRGISYLAHLWKESNRIKVEAAVNTNPTTPNINWVK